MWKTSPQQDAQFRDPNSFLTPEAGNAGQDNPVPALTPRLQHHGVYSLPFVSPYYPDGLRSHPSPDPGSGGITEDDTASMTPYFPSQPADCSAISDWDLSFSSSVFSSASGFPNSTLYIFPNSDTIQQIDQSDFQSDWSTSTTAYSSSPISAYNSNALEYIGSNPSLSRRMSLFDTEQTLYQNDNVQAHAEIEAEAPIYSFTDSFFIGSPYLYQVLDSTPSIEYDITDGLQPISECYKTPLPPLVDDKSRILTEENVSSLCGSEKNMGSSTSTVAAQPGQSDEFIEESGNISEEETCVNTPDSSPAKEHFRTLADPPENCDDDFEGEDKEFNCEHPGCSKTFKKRFEKKKHVNIKHNHRYKCIKCPRAFGVRRDRDRHTADKHPEINPQISIFCPIPECKRSKLGFKKTRKDNLLRHLRKVHKWDEVEIKEVNLK